MMTSGWIPSSEMNGSHKKHKLRPPIQTASSFPKHHSTHSSVIPGQGSFHPRFAYSWDNFSLRELWVCNACLSSGANASLQCSPHPWFLFPKLTTIQETQEVIKAPDAETQSCCSCAWGLNLGVKVKPIDQVLPNSPNNLSDPSWPRCTHTGGEKMPWVVLSFPNKVNWWPKLWHQT